MLAGDEEAKPAKPIEKPKKVSQDEVKTLRAEVRKNEERLDKLNQMRDRLAKKLADPELYETARSGELETWNKKYAEVMNGLDRAEAMWLSAQEKLEAATK
ncbi:MAG: ABC transporter related protein [uncultured bacterium]|nr:MAG: ABC transporter related protein [uncultured bacterium]